MYNIKSMAPTVALNALPYEHQEGQAYQWSICLYLSNRNNFSVRIQNEWSSGRGLSKDTKTVEIHG